MAEDKKIKIGCWVEDYQRILLGQETRPIILPPKGAGGNAALCPASRSLLRPLGPSGPSAFAKGPLASSLLGMGRPEDKPQEPLFQLVVPTSNQFIAPIRVTSPHYWARR